MPWLAHPSSDLSKGLAKSDLSKRQDILHELIYYIFDSFLIPLIRSNFYVTESNVDRNKLFYFRHDVWKSLAEPSLSAFRSSILEELTNEGMRSILKERELGYSQVRLLPKSKGVRPITNLRRRMSRRDGRKEVLGKSINTILAPTFAVLSHEKVCVR